MDQLWDRQIGTIGADAIRSYGVPLFYNLLLDPREGYPALNAPPNFWFATRPD